MIPEQLTAYEERALLAPDIQSNIVALVEAGVIEFDTSRYYLGGLGTGSQSNIVIDEDNALEMFPRLARPLAMATDQQFTEYLQKTDGIPYQFYSLSKSFKMTVAPRFQVEFVIWQPIDADVVDDDADDNLFGQNTFVGGGQGTGYDGTENNYNDFVEKYSGIFGKTAIRPLFWMNFNDGNSYQRTIGTTFTLDEGDSIEYNHEDKRFSIIASGEMVVDNSTDVPTFFPVQIGTFSASNTQKTQEQIETQGLLDDPLTPEDETVEPSSDTAFSDRVASIKRELKFRNRGGRRMLGGLALLGITIGLLYFFTKSKIIQNVKPAFESGIEGGMGVE